MAKKEETATLVWRYPTTHVNNIFAQTLYLEEFSVALLQLKIYHISYNALYVRVYIYLVTPSLLVSDAKIYLHRSSPEMPIM
jgi:hypothetical protein